jgi:hypothetical protein
MRGLFFWIAIIMGLFGTIGFMMVLLAVVDFQPWSNWWIRLAMWAWLLGTFPLIKISQDRVFESMGTRYAYPIVVSLLVLINVLVVYILPLYPEIIARTIPVVYVGFISVVSLIFLSRNDGERTMYAGLGLIFIPPIVFNTYQIHPHTLSDPVTAVVSIEIIVCAILYGLDA